MTNKEIARLLKLTSALLEIHDENPFKIRTYTNAVFKVENLEEQVFGKNIRELESIDGIGKGLARSMHEIFETGTFELLEELKSKTPPGIVEMISLKGIGPKKLRTIWKELNIESTESLYEACLNGSIARLKGFGEKTQETIRENLEYLMSHKGMALFADAEPLAWHLLEIVQNEFSASKFSLTGAMRRKLEIVDCVEVLIGDQNKEKLKKALRSDELFELNTAESGPFTQRGKFAGTDLKWCVRFVPAEIYESKLMYFTGSGKHLITIANEKTSLSQLLLDHPEISEKEAYEHFEKPYIEPEMREGLLEAGLKKETSLPELLKIEDIKGPIHNHSNYSDGKNTIRELANFCIEQGYEYLGLSDHSKSAFYANGLREFDIKRQHEEIDGLNSELAPFKIFKGIESDILNDGALDYEKDVLAGFDFVVASVHSNLNMDATKATTRLLKAIENPYTTILGHPTGRLLLRRPGYPVDFKKIIDACAANGVIIEINANPWRLDLDWRWVHYAIEKNVLLSINPDAHDLDGFRHIKYGVYVGRKGGLTKESTFNTWEKSKIEAYFNKRKLRAGDRVPS